MASEQNQSPYVRDVELRPSRRQLLGRGLAVVVANAIALVVLDWAVAGLTVSQPADALLAGAVLGLVNALVWPAIAVLVVPLSVLTLGLGAVLANAALILVVLDQLPGVDLTGFGAAVAVALGLTVVTTLVSTVLAIDDTAWFDQRMTRRVARRSGGRGGAEAVSDVAGVVFVQIDGLAEPVLRRALASGDAPALHRWLHDGSHRLTEWRTEWSSQTGVSQCGILHGSIDDMPAFRWVEKATGAVLVSNRPESAAVIERRHSDGQGLLAHGGSSYLNLFSGDAERAVMTMSGAGRVKEGRIGAGYAGYFSRHGNPVRTFMSVVVDVWRERVAASDQRRRDVQPRVARSWSYSLLRAYTTVISRDVCVEGVLDDMAEGRSVIYVNMLGYDEVSHHSGPERADTLGVLRDLDRQVARIERAGRWSPRPYHVVVLSDHGQTQGATFRAAFGESLEQLVERLTGAEAGGDPDSGAGNTESTAWVRGVRGEQPEMIVSADLTVLASGSLGLVYLPGPARRLTLEEIDERYPDLVQGLREHPGIGFVLVRSSEHGSMVLGPAGQRVLAVEGSGGSDVVGDVAGGDVVVGDDPLIPYGPGAADMIRRADAYTNVADLMINGRYDPETDEIPAFEEQVGSHGGLGGAQTQPFLLYPASFARPGATLDGPVAVHRTLKEWLADLGHPVATPWREAAR